MHSSDGDEIHVGDTVWFTQNDQEASPATDHTVATSALDSGRVVGLEEGDGGLEVKTDHGRELIGLYTIQFVEPE